MAIIKLAPLDKEGVRFDRPSNEVVWTKLTNAMFKEGSLVPRPGFGPLYDAGADELDTLALELKSIVYIGQVRNPGSTVTGRESFTVGTETVRPDANTTIVAGWTGTFADIDDVVPDSITTIHTATTGAKISVGFAAMGTAWDGIYGAILRGRAKVDEPNTYGTLEFFINNSASLGTLTVAGVGAESDPWVEFAFPLAGYPDDYPSLACTQFADGNFDTTTIQVELDSTQLFEAEVVAPDANGTYSQWKDASDSGTAAFGDVDDYFDLIQNLIPDGTLHYMVPASSGSGNGNKQSFGFTSNAVTFSSVARVKFGAYFSKPESVTPSFSLYWRSAGGTETLVTTVTGKIGSTGMAIESSMTTNPGGGAWTQADFNAGEFFIQGGIGTGSGTVLSHVGAGLEGISSGAAEVHVDYLAIDICGFTSSVSGTGLPDYTRLLSYQPAHIRLSGDGPAGVGFTNVTNSVGFTHPPNIPVDNAVLYGQVYLVNGKDATRTYPTAGNVYTSLTANGAAGNLLTGRTVAAHGNRILYGWVKDNTTITPERIAYSKFNDGSTHNHVSAGDFDLLDTPGGVVKLIPLNEDVLAGLKEEGIYNLIKTGQAAFPYRRDVIDPETGCIAKMTAKRVVLKDGSSAIIFLGENPSKGGVNVFLFDGGQVVPVGNPIAKKLREDANQLVLPFAFAEVDPVSGTYWLFIAENCQDLMPRAAWVLDINSLSWTRAEFPFYISAAGQWNITPTAISSSVGARPLRGIRSMILGSQYLLPYEARYNTAVDVLKGSGTVDTPYGANGDYLKAFTVTLETGDLVRPNDIQIASYRLHMALTLKAIKLRMVVSSSVDGGKNFNTEQEYTIGTDTDFDLDEKQYVYLDLTPSHASQVRYKMEIGPDTTSTFMNGLGPISPWQIDDIRIDLKETASGA